MYGAGGDPQVFRIACLDMIEGMGPKDLKDDLFIRTFMNDREYTGVVDNTKELLRAIDVVHRLTTNNITFQCEDPHHSVKGAFAIGYEEGED
uniref:Uncharacterized protein n=1 Tax=Lactuca sativa TaxID=4236 RepID=A0A9R1UEW9_LACSA|nr:hypothetical protein LSAT_V11C900484910 [Lactuca sativa]